MGLYSLFSTNVDIQLKLGCKMRLKMKRMKEAEHSFRKCDVEGFDKMAMFWKCFWFLLCMSGVGFLVGRAMPKRWFKWDRFPYKELKIENGGQIYKKLMVHRWHKHVPDMSRIFKKMPRKGINGMVKEDTIVLMTQETCIAECTHWVLALLGFSCVFIWPGIGGVIVSLIYLFMGHLPYILIQRYNRPRLVKVLNKMQEKKKKSSVCTGA